MSEQPQGLIHSDPQRFGSDGNIYTPLTAEFHIADKILALARAIHEYLKETAEPEAILSETYRALVRAVEVYWGSPEEYDCPEFETKHEPAPDAKPKRSAGIPFKKSRWDHRH